MQLRLSGSEGFDRFATVLISTLLSWEISGLEARWPHRLEACATGNLTK